MGVEKKYNVFDFINFLFRSPYMLDKPEIKSQFNDSFMLNRRLAIKFPQQAYFIQRLGISDPLHVLEMWKHIVVSQVKSGKLDLRSINKWIYLKGPKNVATKSKSDYKTEDLKELAKFYNYNYKDVLECLEYKETRRLLDFKLAEMKSLKKSLSKNTVQK